MKISIPELGEILDLPLYLSDDGNVSCNHSSCEHPDFHQTIHGRRITVEELLAAIYRHAHSWH